MSNDKNGKCERLYEPLDVVQSHDSRGESYKRMIVINYDYPVEEMMTVYAKSWTGDNFYKHGIGQYIVQKIGTIPKLPDDILEAHYSWEDLNLEFDEDYLCNSRENYNKQKKVYMDK